MSERSLTNVVTRTAPVAWSIWAMGRSGWRGLGLLTDRAVHGSR